mmetsp:Transcript_29465/g.61951  ORF Transcript_29465/g.61951 Transcript_29465/m.61951 type:complete len:276 (-) Transcript_29465:1-828(-)
MGAGGGGGGGGGGVPDACGSPLPFPGRRVRGACAARAHTGNDAVSAVLHLAARSQHRRVGERNRWAPRRSTGRQTRGRARALRHAACPPHGLTDYRCHDEGPVEPEVLSHTCRQVCAQHASSMTFCAALLAPLVCPAELEVAPCRLLFPCAAICGEACVLSRRVSCTYCARRKPSCETPTGITASRPRLVADMPMTLLSRQCGRESGSVVKLSAVSATYARERAPLCLELHACMTATANMATCERCSLVSVKVYVPVIYSPRRGLKRRAAQPQRR